MKIVKTGAALILAATWAVACAAPTDDTSGDGDGDATGPAVPGTGSATAVTGGTTGATGGTTGVTGGTTGVTGGTTGVTGGTTSTGGTASTGTPCANGTVTATALEPLAWDLDGATDAGAMGTAGPFAGSNEVVATLSTWAESGRECVDVSSFTGVQFDLTTSSASGVIFKVGVSAADPAGHCTAPVADCYAHPQMVSVMGGTTIQVPFASLQTASWGVMAPFDATQTVSLIWAIDYWSNPDDENAGLSVSNVSFY